MIIAVAELISMKNVNRQSLQFLLAAILLLLLLCVKPALALETICQTKNDPSFARITISKSDYLKHGQSLNQYVGLKEIAKRTMYRYFGKEMPGQSNKADLNEPMLSLVNKLNVEKKFLSPAGVFVTLSKAGKTRACWGSIHPRESTAARETVLSTLGALNKEYRFKRITTNELKTLKVQVTVVRDLSAVTDIKSVNPLTDGVMVRSGGRGGVILPGEAVDAYYEMVLAKLKAGIKPDEPCQIYKIKAEIYD